MIFLIFFIFIFFIILIIFNVVKLQEQDSYCVIAPMGGGKTAWATNYARDYSEQFAENKIFGNYKLKLPNYIYNPFFFYPLKDLENSLMIMDDVKALGMLMRFASIITNMSRKLNISIIITTQVPKFVVKEIRDLMNYLIFPTYYKNSDTIRFKGIDLTNRVFNGEIINAVRNVKDLYDTKEVVKVPTDTIIKWAIIHVSEYREDLDFNLFLYSGNKRKRDSMLKEILNERDYEYSKEYIEELKPLIGVDLSQVV